MEQLVSLAETVLSKGMQKSRKGLLLDPMEKEVPWSDSVEIIAPRYAKEPEKAGRRPYPLLTMLPIHLMQHWFILSDLAMESERYNRMAMRKFAVLGGLNNPTPNETTILKECLNNTDLCWKRGRLAREKK